METHGLTMNDEQWELFQKLIDSWKREDPIYPEVRIADDLSSAVVIEVDDETLFFTPDEAQDFAEGLVVPIETKKPREEAYAVLAQYIRDIANVVADKQSLKAIKAKWNGYTIGEEYDVEIDYEQILTPPSRDFE